MIDDVSFYCIEEKCPMFGKRVIQRRKVILDHNKKKSRERIVNILKKYDIVYDFSILHDITLVNILTDCCYSNVARKLLGDKIK